MADTKNFKTGSIDFDDILSDFRRYLSYQDEFTNYDLYGSAMSVLMNVLAYNTHYNSVYDNMALNESFLDSAVKRSSVVSHAALIGYTPRSIRAPEAVVTVKVINTATDAPDALTLQKWTPFTTQVDGTTYRFYNNSSKSVARDGTQYVFTDVTIKEGTYVSETYVYQGKAFEAFTLQNQDVDTTTIRVTVRENELSSVSEVYDLADNILNLDDTSKVYFLKQNPDGLYQIQFGTGMLGHALDVGNVITVEYLVTHGDVCNSAKVFNFGGTLPNGSTVYVTTTQPAVGGAQAEDTESVRLIAPRAYATQNRAVTAEDYETIVKQYWAGARSVKAWGGQDELPPQYGKVFVSIIPKEGVTLKESEKKYILENILNPRKGLTTTVEIVDADYLRIALNCTVYFNDNETTLSETDVETAVTETITAYNENNLGDFNSVLRYSQLTTEIDDTDPSITNNITRITLIATLNPQLDVQNSYTLRINNPIYQNVSASECVISSGFYCTDAPNQVCYIDDDPVTETLRLFYKNTANEKVVIRSVGSVDYAEGLLTIDDINITALAENELNFTINPASNDVATSRSQFAIIDPIYLTVNAIANNNYSTEYPHTNSRV